MTRKGHYMNPSNRSGKARKMNLKWNIQSTSQKLIFYDIKQWISWQTAFFIKNPFMILRKTSCASWHFVTSYEMQTFWSGMLTYYVILFWTIVSTRYQLTTRVTVVSCIKGSVKMKSIKAFAWWSGPSNILLTYDQWWVAKHLPKHRKWCNTYSNIICASTMTSIV